jgi:SAM-dependent MidA family methyltransferase
VARSGRPKPDWRGVLFANEVIDALPTTRFTMRDGEIYEEHVTLDGERPICNVPIVRPMRW